MKKVRTAIILSVLVFFLSSCYDPGITFEKYPWYKAETWHCQEIDMTMHFELDENGSITAGTYSQLTVDGVTHSVAVAFHASTIAFMVFEDGEPTNEKGLDGSYFYRDGNLVVKVNSESILNGKYTELMFFPVQNSK